MSFTLQQLLHETPSTVLYRDIHPDDDIDLRRSCVDVLFVNTIGMNADSADWLPNDDPPDRLERLAWIWFIRPDLADDMADMLDGDFRLLVEYYRDGKMDDWWSHMTAA